MFTLVFSTVLSSAGNDGRIRLWKATSGNVWRPAGSIGVEQTEENENEHSPRDNQDFDMEKNTEYGEVRDRNVAGTKGSI